MIEVSPLGLVAVGVIALALVFFTFGVAVIQLRRFSMRVRGDVVDRAGIQNKVRDIDAMLTLQTPLAARLAVIEADRLFDYALKEMSFVGETMGDRLKRAAAKDRRIKDVWGPHTLRNALVHEHGKTITAGEAKRAIGIYKTALRDLGVL